MKRILACGVLVLAGLVPTLGVASAAPPADQISIDSPSLVRNQVVYDITLRGFARHRSTAHLFVDYAGCAPTFAAEARRIVHAYDSYAVLGSFAEVSGWKSSSAGIDHACAYLVTRSGLALASDRIAFPVH